MSLLLSAFYGFKVVARCATLAKRYFKIIFLASDPPAVFVGVIRNANTEWSKAVEPAYDFPRL